MKSNNIYLNNVSKFNTLKSKFNVSSKFNLSKLSLAKFKVAKFLVLILVFAGLVGCSATHTAISKRKLDVQTKMSATIFLDPVAPNKRTVFVQVRNTTDQQSLDIEGRIKSAILEKGYKVVNNPDQAHYLLQANVLRIGSCDLRATNDALGGGFGGALSGALIGGTAGALASNHSDGMIAGALIGGVIGTITDAMVKDVNYVVITDVQISERSGATAVRERTRSTLQQGTSGTKEITATEKTNWKRYQTRIVSSANKVNLKFDEAAGALIAGLSRSIAGIF